MSENSSSTRDAELAAVEVAAILAAAPTAGAAPGASSSSSSGGGGGDPSTSQQQGRAGDEVEDEDDDVEMGDAAQESQQEGAAVASTAAPPANSGPGRSPSPSPLPSDSDDDELSVLSSISGTENDSDESDDQSPPPPGRQQNGSNGNQGRRSTWADAEDDSGSSDISEPTGDDAQRRGGQSDDEDDDDEEDPYVEDPARIHPAVERSSRYKPASEDGASGSDDDADDDRRNVGPSAAAAAAGAQSEDQPASATVVSDSSDLGSPESIADTEPLPFEDSQAQAGEAAPVDDDEDEEEEEEEQRGRGEAPTPTAASLAEAVKDDREEVTTGSPQEAMESLTRIEIQFAMLRDRLYVERMEEVCRETEMVLEGTHPELIRFTRAIDQVRERRLRLLDLELEKQVNHYEQVAEGEEHVIWNSYRYQAADLRQDMMDESARKRRRLEREKRLIDVPRPARRHQTFETELVPNPDRQYSAALRARRREIAIADASAAVAAAGSSHPDSARRAAGVVQQLQEGAAEEDANDYVAYPEVKGLDESELWSDLDRMGGYPANWAMGSYEPAR